LYRLINLENHLKEYQTIDDSNKNKIKMSNQIADLNKVVESKTEYLEFESV
jgi:hypothetical protein